MKISKNWLNNYITTTKSDSELVDFFTNLGLECVMHNKEYNFRILLN